MHDRILEICQRIAKETDHEKLVELARELDYTLTEHSLKVQNEAFVTSQQVASLQ